MTSQPVLRCEGISFRIGSRQILDGIDFSARAGEICGIVGPNGSGKSMFLNVISGFVKPQAGQIVLDGRNVSGTAPFRRARAGLGRSFQRVRIVETATAAENVEAGLLMQHSPGGMLASLGLCRREGSAEEVRRALERVQAAEFSDWPVRYLSGGTRRKVEVARAIVGKPKVLLVDEPTGGVSSAHILALERVLREEAEQGAAVVIVDHNLEFIGKIAPRVVVFVAGTEVFQGTPAAAWSDPRVIEAYLGK
jgi:ABC-type branched-subunit amino acid transport system ATPase component